MNKRVFILFLFLVTTTLSFGQDKYYFRASFLLSGNQLKSAETITLLVNGTPVRTGTDGSFEVYVIAGKQEIRVESPDERSFIIVGTGALTLPQDKTVFTPVYLRKATDMELANRSLNKALKQMGIQQNQLAELKLTNNAQYQYINSKIDSLITLTSQQYQVNASNLRSMQELMAGRDKTFPVITSTLQYYLNEAFDIRDAFSRLLTIGMKTKRGFFILDSTMRVYNAAYNELNSNHINHEDNIKSYWQSNELSMLYANTVDYALNNVHRSEILLLNTTLIPKANKYLLSSNKKEKEKIYKQVEEELERIQPILTHHLNILNDKVRALQLRLAAEKDVFNN
ncbi:MAG: hypothetical protein ACXWV4_09925 [Flavitalea sp.]